MQTIPTILNFPNGTPIDAVQGKIRAYERKSINTANGAKSKQNAILEDVSGEKIRLEVWEHPDLQPLDGQEVVLFANGKGGKGVTLKRESYKKESGEEVKKVLLSVSKAGQFQSVSVYKGVVAPNKADSKPSEVPGVSTPPSGGEVAPKPQNTPSTAIRGDKVGMALHCASRIVAATINSGNGFASIEALNEFMAVTASNILRLSTDLESGKTFEKKAQGDENVPF